MCNCVAAPRNDESSCPNHDASICYDSALFTTADLGFRGQLKSLSLRFSLVLSPGTEFACTALLSCRTLVPSKESYVASYLSQELSGLFWLCLYFVLNAVISA